MDISILTAISSISTSTSGVSTTGNGQHVALARKLQEMRRRTKYAHRIIRAEGCLDYGGCTAERVGPPTFLGADVKDQWRKDIRRCAHQCVGKYLLPQYLQKIELYKNKVLNNIEVGVTEENRERVEIGIQLGIDRANRKWDRREGFRTGSNDSKGDAIGIALTRIGPHNEEEIGQIRRGEEAVGVEDIITISTTTPQTDNAYRILAQDIYGSVRFSNIISRNVWKYIYKYEAVERKNFVPFMGRLTNQTERWISNWRMFCAFISNRDLVITTYELDIVSRLYDVKVKVYRVVRGSFDCTWTSTVDTKREVKLLVNEEYKWVALHKVKRERGVASLDEAGQREGLSDNTNGKEKVNNTTQTENMQDRSDMEGIDRVKNSLFGEGSSHKSEESNTVNNTTGDKQDRLKRDRELANLVATGRTEGLGVDNNSNEKPNTTRQAESMQKRGDSTDRFINSLFGEGSSHMSEESNTTSNTTGDKQDAQEREAGRERNEQKWKFWQVWRKRVRDKKRNKEKKRIESRRKEEIRQRSKQLVFDFTTEGLGEAELAILSKGEIFCTTTNRVDLDRLKTDIFNFSRRLRLHEEFRDPTVEKEVGNRGSGIPQTLIARSNTPRHTNRMSAITQTPQIRRGNNNNTQGRSSMVRSNENTGSTNRGPETQNSIVDTFTKNKIRKPVSLYDPVSQNRNLNRYITCMSEESLLIAKKKIEFRDNISAEQRQAIRTLKDKIDTQKIIISKADKGSGLVVVDYDMYIRKGTKYIEEEANAYSKVEDNAKSIIERLTKARDHIVQKLKNTGVIESETATYCTKQLEEKITGIKFYYKIHKDTNIVTMPLRPLQSCINSPTHHLSQVLTDVLQPYLSNSYIPTYIQDSNQLLFRLENMQNLRPTDTLISSDVAALYPSIPYQQGMEAISEFLQGNSGYDMEQVGTIVKALELVTTENYIVWNNQLYKQTSGVAMGTPVAVAYANIFMNWIDEEIRQRAEFVVDHIRYIDDNLFIIPEDRIDELMQIANDILRPHIRFTYETLDKKADIGLAFLDTQLFITQEGKIEARLFTKKTDKHAYLLPSSFHPAHITKNIPKAVFNRIRRLCSREEWFQIDASKAVKWLEDREYKEKDIKRAMEGSKRKDRWTLIKNIENKWEIVDSNNKNKKQEVYEIPFLVTYGYGTQQIRKILKRRQGLLDASFIKTKVRPRLTFRRQNNINDLLVQKALRGPITNTEDKVFNICGEKPKYRTMCLCRGTHNQKICRCCAHAKLVLDKIEIRLTKSVDCNTKNIIYLIGCHNCSKKYIGETQQKLRDRLMQHLSNIGKQKQPLYTHFSTVHKPNQLYISILETVRSEEPAYKRVREAWWINKL